MKKTLLAAALLAGFAGTAQGETSVTLYGIIDLGLGYQQIKGPGGSDYNQSKFGMLNGVQSGSRWGLRGSEDLGDGLRAVFNIEAGFSPSNGTSLKGGRLFDRRATLGLASDNWGRINFGRQVNIASQYFEAIDPFALGFGQANMGTIFGAANTQRYDNTVMFQTPMFNSFQAGLGYSFNAIDTDVVQTGWPTADNTRAITAGLRYINGPMNVALTYDQLNGSDRLNVGDTTPKQVILGGSYDFEAFKLALAVSQTRDGWFAPQQGINAFGSGQVPIVDTLMNAVDQQVTAAGGQLPLMNSSSMFLNRLKVNSYMIGASAPLGGGSNLFASWLMADPKGDLSDVGFIKKWQVYSVGYLYDFSKHTDMYAMGSYAKNYSFFDGLNSTVVGVGVFHRF